MLHSLIVPRFLNKLTNRYILPGAALSTSHFCENKKSVRIGCASAFWGDTATSTHQLVNNGNVDFVVYDYLAEVTMSIMTAAKLKNPEMGFAPDFVKYAVGPNLPVIKEKGTRIVSNAGGTNPEACAKALKTAAKSVGYDLDVAVVLGDNMMDKQKQLHLKNIREMGSGELLPKTVMSMNAYLGAEPIRKALDLGAEVVVTGRCADSSVVLGPLMHTFNWSVSDYDRLASGSLAGHLLECGAQATGGIFTDWHSVPGWDNIGFPVVECFGNGDFMLTKPEHTGGLVSPFTVAEQLVYEIGDPAAYILPDVVCDFTGVQISQSSPDAVWVAGAKGHPPTDTYKVCATYLDGYRTSIVLIVVGKRAQRKALRSAENVIKRVRRLLSAMKLDDFKRVQIQAIGDESLYGANARVYGEDGEGPREAAVWIAVEHSDKKAIDVFGRELAASATGMAPGLTGANFSRPKPSPVLKLFSFLHQKSDFKAEVRMGDQTCVIDPHLPANQEAEERPAQGEEPVEPIESGTHSFLLEDLALTRSGDKGNSANIGVIARHPSYWPFLKHHLTAEVVHEYFKHLFSDGGVGIPVKRYELPGVKALNFVLEDCLGGGGMASLRIDPQGKGLGQMLLDLKLDGLPDLMSRARSA